jgi:hypothetical protein
MSQGEGRAQLCVITAATDNRVVARGDAADCGARVASRTGLWLRADVMCARLLVGGARAAARHRLNH